MSGGTTPRAPEERLRVVHLRHSRGGGGGADTAVLTLLSRLDPSRFDSRVIYLRRRNEDLRPLRERFQAANVPLTEMPGGPWLDPLQLGRLVRLVREARPRILHCHDPKSDVLGRVVGTLEPGLRLVSTLHGWIDARRRSRLYRGLDLLALRGFHRVAAVSRATGDEAAARGLSGVSVVPNGVDLEFWSRAAAGPREDRHGDVVGFVGRLSREKGAGDFLRAAALVARARPGCRFLVAGEGPLQSEMRATAAEPGLRDRVTFAGLLDAAALRRAYAGMDLLLIPSHSEGLPFTLLEAMAMEVPVVATLAGGVGEAVEDGDSGLLVASGDVDGLARAVSTLLADPSRGVALAAAARRRVEASYSLDAVARRWESIYLECAERGSR